MASRSALLVLLVPQHRLPKLDLVAVRVAPPQRALGDATVDTRRAGRLEHARGGGRGEIELLRAWEGACRQYPLPLTTIARARTVARVGGGGGVVVGAAGGGEGR